MDERVRAYYAVQRLPDERVARILAAAGAAETPRIIRWRRPQWLAAAAALMILLGGAALWRATPVYAAGRVVAEVAQTHCKAYVAHLRELLTKREAPATAKAPKPNEYDAKNDRYWNADHGHWHPGRPPTGK